MRVYTRSTAAGSWVEREFVMDSCVVTDAVNERSTAAVTILDSTGVVSFERGHGLKVTRGGTDLFVGFIMQAEESRLAPGGYRRHAIDAADLHYLADKRIAARSYADSTAGEAIQDLIDTYLSAEGITAGVIQAGATIRRLTFRYIPVSDALSQLAERSGFWWRINPDGTLDFATPTDLLTYVTVDTTAVTVDQTDVSSDAVTGGTLDTLDLAGEAIADTVQVKRHAPGYRNRQWLRGGRDLTATQVEIQVGDGDRRAFALGYPVAEEPVIEVQRSGGAWTEQTVGPAGLTTEAQWFFTYNSATLQQNVLGTVLTNVDRIRVTYRGLFDVVARVDDEPEQNDQAVIEGGTGIVEHVLLDRTIETRDAAIELGGELLDYYTDTGIVVRYVTTSTDVTPGTVVNITLAEAGIEAQTAVATTVEHFTRGEQERSVVTFAAGPIDQSWAQWFGALSRRLDKLQTLGGGEVEVVTTQEVFSKTWTQAETPNIFRETRAKATGGAVAGPDTYPEFDTEDRVTHLAVIRDGVEVFRKPYTAQTGTATAEVVTTVLLTVSDAVGEIDQLSWVGGWGATNVAGSGVEVDRQAFVYTKTDVEQLQIVKTDTKWS